MGRRYLIDSNVIIDYAANKLPDKSLVFVEQLFPITPAALSAFALFGGVGLCSQSHKISRCFGQVFLEARVVFSVLIRQLFPSLTHKFYGFEISLFFLFAHSTTSFGERMSIME